MHVQVYTDEQSTNSICYIYTTNLPQFIHVNGREPKHIGFH